MENNILNWSGSPELFFIITAAIAAGLGIYGLYILTSLTRSPDYESRGFQTERFMLGLFNIAISVVAIYTMGLIMQVNPADLFTQSNKLLGQLK